MKKQIYSKLSNVFNVTKIILNTISYTEVQVKEAYEKLEAIQNIVNTIKTYSKKKKKDNVHQYFKDMINGIQIIDENNAGGSNHIDGTLAIEYEETEND